MMTPRYETIGEGIYRLQGKRDGKILVILGGVHGNEVCGINALYRLMPRLQIDSGTLYCIYGNPRAIEKGVRHTGLNLNRAFRDETTFTEQEKLTYEFQRSRELMPILQRAHAALDIHSSATEHSPPFIICEPQSFSVAQHLPFKIRSHGWDALEPLGVDGFVNQTGGYGICVECGYNLDPLASGRASKAIRAFLGFFESSQVLRRTQQDQDTYFAYAVYRTRRNFRPARTFKDFETIGAQTLVGHDGEEPVYCEVVSRILFCRNRTGPHEEAFLLLRAAQDGNE